MKNLNKTKMNNDSKFFIAGLANWQQYFLVLILVVFSQSSCKKFIDVPPPIDKLVGSTVFESNSTAASAINGIYSTMVTTSVAGGTYGPSVLLGLSSDELSLFSVSALPEPILTQAYVNALTSQNAPKLWADYYNCIYQSNSALWGLSNSTKLDQTLKQQLIGEAKFIRAYCYFNLVNIYGEIPLVLKTDYKTNSKVAKSNIQEIYSQIIQDLRDAQNLLSENYVKFNGAISTDRIRPNRWAATGLLSKVYLYQEKWDSSEVEATRVLQSPLYTLDSDLNQISLPTSTEAIWQLEPAASGFNAPDGILRAAADYGGPSTTSPLLLSDSLINLFQTDDRRYIQWIGSLTSDGKVYHYANKYKLGYTGIAPTEYPVLLRLSEIYLIRSEALAHQNKVEESLSDLNVIRIKAGIPELSISLQSELLEAISKERRLELFTEFGNRWYDLKRTNKIDEVMAKVTPEKRRGLEQQL